MIKEKTRTFESVVVHGTGSQNGVGWKVRREGHRGGKEG